MKPIRQKVHYVDLKHNTCMVMSGKGNIYPVDLNHYCKSIKTGDTALVVKSIHGEWLLVDVEPKYPHSNPLDVTQFPRDNNNCLNVVEYWKYRAEFDKLRTDRERNEMNLFLIELFKEKYGYDALKSNVEPTSATTTLEE